MTSGRRKRKKKQQNNQKDLYTRLNSCWMRLYLHTLSSISISITFLFPHKLCLSSHTLQWHQFKIFLFVVNWLHAGWLYCCRQFCQSSAISLTTIISYTNSRSDNKKNSSSNNKMNTACIWLPLVFYTNARSPFRFEIHTIRHQKYYWWCKWLQLAHTYFKWFALNSHCSYFDQMIVNRGSNIFWWHKRNKKLNSFKSREKKITKTKTCVTISQMADFNGQLISIVGRSKKNTTNLCQLNHDVHTFGHHKKKQIKTKRKRKKNTKYECLLRSSSILTFNFSKQTGLFFMFIMLIIWNILGCTHA